MILQEMNPFIRFAATVTCSVNDRTVIAYDNRLFDIVEGEGSININGRVMPVAPDTLILIPPGTPYSFHGAGRFRMMDLNFDYTQSRRDATEGVPPDLPECFREEAVFLRASFTDYPVLNAPLVLANHPGFRPMLGSILERHRERDRFSAAFCSAACKTLLVRLVDEVTRQELGNSRKVGRVIDYIRENLGKELDNAALARLLGYHSYTVNRLMKAYTGTTLRQYLIETRVNEAKRLLGEEELSVREIAERCGYREQSHFSVIFRQKTGLSPEEYRKKLKLYL